MSEDPRHGTRTAKRTGLCSRFRHDRRGSTAIEFGLLALPFALLVFAILESCISFAAQEVMANATDNVARQLRTGQLNAATVTSTSLTTEICNQLEIIVSQDCPQMLSVDLRQYATFADAAAAGFSIQTKEIVLTGTSPATFTVSPGPANPRTC